MELYGIAELSGVFGEQHFVGTRQAPLAIDGDPVDHVLDRHRALGVRNVIWNLGRSYVDFWTDHPLLTRKGELTVERGLEDRLRPAGRRLLDDFRRRDPLARAIDGAHERGMPLWGWLCMNRFYPHDASMMNQTRLWLEGRGEMTERYRDGSRDESRLCYAFPEVRAERMAAVLEAARVTGPRTGRHVQAIVLDFCRQPPMLQYHPRLCRAYARETGLDPREILAADIDRFMPWVRWRAALLTRFVREVRAELNRLAEELGCRIDLAARITDLGPQINLIEGVDVVTLCKEHTIDALVTSPLNWIRGVWEHDLRPYVTLGHRHGVRVIAGVSLNQMTRFHGIGGAVSGVVLARRVQAYQRQGTDGIAFYQSESGLEFDGFESFIPALCDPETTAALLEDEAFLRRWPDTYLNSAYGLDCHSWFNDYTIDGRVNFGQVDWRAEGFTIEGVQKRI